MPSIETNRKRFEAAKEQGNIVPVEKSVVINPAPPIPTYPAAPNANLRTPLPAISVMQPDMQRQWQTGATPQQRIPPTSATSNPIVGAQAASQTIIAIQGGAGGPVLETNNLKNNIQGILNLLAGTNISLSADARGGVTITSTSGGDGLIHGDTIWEIDPAYASIRDEFIGGNITSGSVGELGWTVYTASGGNISPTKGIGGLPAMGALRISNSGTANGYANINLANSSDFSDTFIPLFDYPVGWKAVFVFGFSVGNQDAIAGPFFTQKSIYVGLASTYDPTSAPNWPARPNIFYGVRYDTDTTSPTINDATFKFEVVNNLVNTTTTNTRNNTQGTVVDTGVTPTMGSTYRLEIQMVAAGKITMSLNGSTPQSFNISTIIAGGTGAAGQASLDTNIGRVKIGPTTAQFDQTFFVGGSKVVVAGHTGGQAVLNGSWTLISTNPGVSSKFAVVSGNLGNSSVNNTSMTGYPGVLPIFSFGNDTQAAPAANHLSFFADFFSLAWNPEVGGGTGTPNSTHSRYFN